MSAPDWVALAALRNAAFPPPERPWSAAEFAGLAQSPGAAVIAEPRGYALIRVAADEAELLSIAVAPEARRRGAGRALLAAAEARALEAGALVLHLEVAEDNAPARGLYAGAGYEIAGRRRGYYAGGDALTMRRTLRTTDPAR